MNVNVDFEQCKLISQHYAIVLLVYRFWTLPFLVTRVLKVAFFLFSSKSYGYRTKCKKM